MPSGTALLATRWCAAAGSQGVSWDTHKASHVPPPPASCSPRHAVGPNCMGIAAENPGLAKYITGAIGFPFALLQASGWGRCCGYRVRWGPGLMGLDVPLSSVLQAGCGLWAWPAQGLRQSMAKSCSLKCPHPTMACPCPRRPRCVQILVCGSELFTGNTALCFSAVLEGKAKISGMLKNWVRRRRSRHPPPPSQLLSPGAHSFAMHAPHARAAAWPPRPWP